MDLYIKTQQVVWENNMEKKHHHPFSNIITGISDIDRKKKRNNNGHDEHKNIGKIETPYKNMLCLSGPWYLKSNEGFRMFNDYNENNDSQYFVVFHRNHKLEFVLHWNGFIELLMLKEE